MEYFKPGNLRFPQDSIARAFQEPKEGTVMELAENLRNGVTKASDVEPIQVVERNGLDYGLGSRRLAAFQMAGEDIQGIRVPYSASMERYFTTENLGTSIVIRGVGVWSPDTGLMPFEE